jgi:hypothetical protein
MRTGGRKEVMLRAVALAIAFVSDAPPIEFRIFSAGENTTTKGTFLFDAVAARDVMSAYEAHGTDLMIDLEHLSLESPKASLGFDPDARGWCKLEVRNGELWAAQVSWTPDGAARLTEKRQRYTSPAFEFDSETHRITRLLNIAITALPATDNLQPLVAASRRNRLAYGEEGTVMTAEQLAQLAEVLGLGADANVEDVLAQVAAVVRKVQDAANGAPADAGGEAAAAAADAPKPEDAPPMAAAKRLSIATRTLARLTGKPDFSASIAEVEAWRTSHLELEGQRAKLSQERTVLEGSERRKLVAELVKLGAETPATAWADDDAKAPCKRLAEEPIADLRGRVAKLTAAKGAPVRTELRPPPAGGNDAHGLTAEQLRYCEQSGCKPEVFAALRKVNAPITLRS